MSGESAGRLLGAANDPQRRRRQRRREFIDRWCARLMAVGGLGVIVAILLIFVYLVLVVAPLFTAASVQPLGRFAVPALASHPALAIDEYGELGLAFDTGGTARFYTLADGGERRAVPLAAAAPGVTRIAHGAPQSRSVALGLADGSVLVVRHDYDVSYPDDRRHIEPRIEQPLGEAPIAIDPGGAPLAALAVQSTDSGALIAAQSGDGLLRLVSIETTTSLIDETTTTERAEQLLDAGGVLAPLAALLLDPDRHNLWAITRDGTALHWDVRNPSAPAFIGRVPLAVDGAMPTVVALLAGGHSLLVGDDAGRVTQWFPVRDAEGTARLQRIRGFALGDAPIVAIGAEHTRKVFAAADATGAIGLFHTTAERTLLRWTSSLPEPRALAFSPSADTLAIVSATGEVERLAVHDPHPEVSLSALWGRVWYESRDAPAYVWQSSSASSDFEPKLSLTPLTFGTLKGALYAMAFAIPLAIMGAVYTGYFMTGPLRGGVKPVIEVMAAMPTVILGFLAGLWLAPLVEENLPGVLLTFLLVPLGVLGSAWLASLLPVRHRLPEGAEVLALVPVVALLVWLCMLLSHPIEAWWFDGDAPGWVTRVLGLSFDQRNSLVVGIAMGFAVIPNVFTIAEDAVFGVPRHLTIGSLALGATPWQTLTRVVLLTASPGIFSGVMIGFGRAVGETMIVLMATGNTPVIDLNPFSGFRALSANVATEMPESAVGSTHFRVLFLAALVLFVVTFAFNTLAEVVRQRLRVRYSTL